MPISFVFLSPTRLDFPELRLINLHKFRINHNENQLTAVYTVFIQDLDLGNLVGQIIIYLKESRLLDFHLIQT